MADSIQTPIAEYRDLRWGVDDRTTLFADRVEVRWKRQNQAGEFSFPLYLLSPHFDRRGKTGDRYYQLVWLGIAFVVVACVGAYTLPFPYSDHFGLGGGVGAAFCFFMVVFCGLRSNNTQWCFMNVMHSNTVLTLNARPQDVASAEAFVAAFVKQIRSSPWGQCAACGPDDLKPLG